MNLVKDAKVWTNNGQEIGKLSRLVIDPRTKNVTDIVFTHGLLSQNEYILPMRLVDHTDEEGIHLGELPVNDPKELSPFLEEHFLMTDETAMMAENQFAGDTMRSYYPYPPAPFGTSSVLRPNDLFMTTPGGTVMGGEQLGVPVSGKAPVIHEEEENIPEGTVAVKEGARVLSSDLKHIGDVNKVFVDSNSGRVSHLIISKGLLFKQYKLIPVEWIQEITGDGIYLAVDEGVARRIPEYQGKRNDA